jgi:iron complex outermembrane receptor protein
MRMSFKQSLFVGSSIAAFAMAAGSAFAQSAPNEAETVIVTGTRVQGMTAADSAAPIQVLGTDALTHGTGSADLRQQLGQSIPSFTAQQVGFDTADLTLSAALRGLSPNDTLVLVNGHRRHYTGNLHVDSGNFASGSAAPDISLIPSGAIDHVEVLLDGAAAQYGTDAIAGVVNFILKNKSSGGTLSASAGDYFNRGGVDTANGVKAGGTKYDLSYNMGMPLFDKGFVNFTVEKQYGNLTQLDGVDIRIAGGGANGTGLQAGPLVNGDIPLAVAQKMAGYPFINPIDGAPEYQLTQAEVNTAYDFSDNFQIYSFGTISHRAARAYENVRVPDRVITTPGSSQPCSATNPTGYDTGSSTANGLTPTCGPNTGGTFAVAGSVAPGTPGAGLNSSGPKAGQVIFSGGGGTYTTPGELIAAPEGFRPMEALKEDDYQYNIGEKFNLAGWAVDADVSYGKDIDNIYTLNSLNRSLFIDTHTSPTNFFDGTLTASQFTGTIDASHSYNVGMASPLTVAIGGEAREDAYAIAAGDPGSQYKEGGNSFPGYLNASAGDHSRKNYAGYIDLALAPIEALQLDVAGRVEHYSDFGDAQIGKVTARYDFTPQWAIRGTISTGFRAPTLAEEFYNAVNVSPTSNTTQLPADSAAAKVLGLQNLKPEVSTSYSAGIVAHPLQDLSMTVDVYSTTVGNRIVNSSTVYSAGRPGTVVSPLVTQAILAAGQFIDPTVTQIGVTAFLNGINTLTQGVDFTANYPTDLGDMGLINWTLAGNYNTTAVSRVAPTPAVFGGSAVQIETPENLYTFTHSAPADKVVLSADWSLDQYGITWRETYWGPQHGVDTPSGSPPDFTANQAGVVLTDLEARYNFTDAIQFAVGANNIFNIRPDLHQYDVPDGTPADGGLIANDHIIGAFDPTGGYYYGRLTYNF